MAAVTQQQAAPKSTLPMFKKPSIGDITSKGAGLPSAILIHAERGWGKTSLAAHAAAPIFIKTRNEDGLGSLIDSNVIKPTPSFPTCVDYLGLCGAVMALVEDPHEYKTLVLDTINGSERLVHEYVCARDFGDDWEKFAAYGRGPETAMTEMIYFTTLLDRARVERKMSIILLAHSKVKTAKNPGGSDYDRYQVDMTDKCLGPVDRWVSAVLFGGFEMLAIKEHDVTKKAKMIGGTQRVLYTQPNAAYAAKNQLGLPDEIDCGLSAAEGFAALRGAMAAARRQAVAGAVAEETKKENK